MTYHLVVGDPRTVARVINMAHRFQCRATRVDSHTNDELTTADFVFDGPDAQLGRLRAQIDRIVQFEKIFIS